jgi:hypothetical protein
MRVGSARTIQTNHGSMMVVELRESFAKIPSATKMQILSLNLFATAAQGNDLAVLSHSCLAGRYSK